MISRLSYSYWMKCITLLCFSLSQEYVGAFTPIKPNQHSVISAKSKTTMQMSNSNEKAGIVNKKNNIACFLSSVVSVGVVGAAIFFPGIAIADEIGSEIEAPTLFTGETVEICTKRGPLGACTKTELRTAENDNDKATKYFKDPAASLKEKYSAAQLQSIDDGESKKVIMASDGNELIERLKQQSADNKDRNDKIIRAKTLQNDMAASFGPLDSQVAILNSDGESFTLLKGAQAMRLKKMGYIKDKRFVTQPTTEVIDAAFESEGGGPGEFIGGIMKGVFGSGNEDL
mmetsp:Transcript_15197/g.17363  ORF Transcript_15197/g.17363 Transcript_15197/m.17363 type:complete len:287 (-) Transcript_15197:159-1019(-)